MKRNIVIATVAAMALVGGGTATALAATGDDDSSAAAKKSSVQLKDHDRDNDSDRDDDRYDDRDDRDDAKENTAEAKASKVTAADAIKAALAEKSGTAVSAELDDEDNGGLVWDVDVLGKGSTWYSVQVDPGTGKVLGSHTDQDDDDADDASRVAATLKGASTTAQDAAKAAAAKGTVTSIDLDDDGTAKAWEAETASGKGAESDWKVDLQSGKVSADKSDSQDSDHDSDDNDSDDDADGSDD